MKDFKGNLGHYKIVLTDDGTPTLWSEAYNENCHSTSGAYEETLHNFIKGCQLENILQKNGEVSIFETGFGLGIGLKATIEYINSQNFPLKGIFISTEIDEALVEWSMSNTNIENSSVQLTNLVKHQKCSLTFYQLEVNDFKLIILIGDARKSIPKALKHGLINKVDCFYQDAFSPKQNPSLWTIEWFQLLGNLAKKNSILSTYSASSSIRKTLIAAGWGVFTREGFGKKRSSTQAFWKKEGHPEIIKNLSSSKINILRDPL